MRALQKGGYYAPESGTFLTGAIELVPGRIAAVNAGTTARTSYFNDPGFAYGLQPNHARANSASLALVRDYPEGHGGRDIDSRSERPFDSPKVSSDN
jgi:hypothetical protein